MTSVKREQPRPKCPKYLMPLVVVPPLETSGWQRSVHRTGRSRSSARRQHQASGYARRWLLRESQVQRFVSGRVLDLRVVERGEAESELLRQITELDVVLAAGGELAADLGSEHAIGPTRRNVDVATVTRQRIDEERGHLVARLELAVVERNLIAVHDVVGPSGVRGLAVLVHELGLAADEVKGLVLWAPRIALATCVRCGLGVVARVVQVLVVDLAEWRRAAAL